MGDILDLSERYWRGEIPPRDLWRPTGKSEELDAGVHFFHAWAYVTAIRTEAGLVLVDTGTYTARARTFAAVRAVEPGPLHAAVYTHGHVDHACGLPPFLEEARAKGRPAPSIVGHRNIAGRFDRYRPTAPRNGLINSRQFSTRSVWPTEYDYPTVVYDATHVLGTGVLARPDGTILTVAHLVSQAKHIVVHCPGRKETVAGTDALARPSGAASRLGPSRPPDRPGR